MYNKQLLGESLLNQYRFKVVVDMAQRCLKYKFCVPIICIIKMNIIIANFISKYPQHFNFRPEIMPKILLQKLCLHLTVVED